MSGKVAFVVQRCGLEVNGGAELLCRLIAQQMAFRRPTEVLTTCALDYVTWADHYPPGEEKLGDLVIRRFPVARPRDIDAFNELSRVLHPRIGTLKLAEEEKWMREQGPWSPALLEYLKKHKRDYDAFIFFTYLYATTYFGLPLVEDKAVLVPTAHDEWPIYFQMWNKLFERPRAFVFQTPEEVAFLRRRFPDARLNGPVLGVAVDPPPSTDPEGFRKAFGLDKPPHEMIVRENLYSASRFGIEGNMIDYETGKRIPTRQFIRKTLQRLQPDRPPFRSVPPRWWPD